VPVGATVYCLSHPELDCSGTVNGFYTLTRGIVCGKFRFPAGGEKPLDWLAITADYAQGSSGGPILNHNGAVVGMVCKVMSLCDESAGGAPQMTWKLARPSASILALLRGSAGRN
jgi:serine protease Do